MKLRIANPSREEMDKFLLGVVGVVEANSYESMCLWQEQHERAGKTWKSGGGGPMVQVGEIADMPVCISLLVNEVDGHRILFGREVRDRGRNQEREQPALQEQVCGPGRGDRSCEAAADRTPKHGLFFTQRGDRGCHPCRTAGVSVETVLHHESGEEMSRSERCSCRPTSRTRRASARR
jgi:hypothetical protein